MDASVARFAVGDWRILLWSEGAAAYNVHRGDTHALDVLTAEVLRHGGSVSCFDAAVLSQIISDDLNIPADEAFRLAVAQSLQRLCDLAHE